MTDNSIPQSNEDELRKLLKQRIQPPAQDLELLTYEITQLIHRHDLENRIDLISDVIIECYDYDNPMDIAKELEEERNQLQIELQSHQKGTAE